MPDASGDPTPPPAQEDPPQPAPGAILLPGITVGDNAVIGAGSIVTKDVPANTLAVGNPCRGAQCSTPPRSPRTAPGAGPPASPAGRAGSIVTKDVPANTLAVGNPCRTLREIGEHDRAY